MNKASKKSLLSGTGLVSGLTAISRILGFVRDLAFALIFGTSTSADAFFVAFRVPNLLRSFVAEGALTSAFVPIFSDEVEKGDKEAKKALREAFGLILCITIIITLFCLVFADYIVSFLAPGFNSEKQQLCSLLLQIMIPFILALSFVSIINGALNTVHIFGSGPIAQIVMNISLIIGALTTSWYATENKIFVMSYWVLVGGILQVLAQIPMMKKAGFSIFPTFFFISNATKNIAKLMIPAILGSAVYQISIVLSTVLASVLISGSVSWLYYADRIAQLPIGIFTIALSSVLLPLLARSASKLDEAHYSKTTVDALRYVNFILIPTAFIFFLFSDQIVKLIYERGEFDSQSTLMVSHALKGYAFGLWTISCQSVLSRAFIAKKDPLTPAIVAFFAILGGLHVSLMCMGEIPLSVDYNNSIFTSKLASYQSDLYNYLPHVNLSHVGLAIGSSATSFLAFICFIVLFLKRQRDCDLRPFVKSAIISILSSLSMIAITFTSLHFIIQIAIAGILYLCVSALLQSEESKEILTRLKTKS